MYLYHLLTGHTPVTQQGLCVLSYYIIYSYTVYTLTVLLEYFIFYNVYIIL